MDNSNNKIQLSTSSRELPSLNTPEAIAEVRLDERRYPRYRNQNAVQRRMMLSKIIQGLVTITRIRDFDGEAVVDQANALDDMIMKNEAISGLTMVEMAEAFKSGVFGLYGEFYGLSAPNLYGFLRSYLESELKQDATAMVRTRFEEKKRLEQEERQRRIRAEIEEAKRNGSFVPTGNAWFKPQTVNEVIDNSAHREMVRQQAREILNNQ